MLKISSKRFGEDTVMRVTDEALDVWMFEVDDNWSGCGAGRDHVWVGDREGAINIYDVAARTKSAEINIQRGKEWRSTSVSKDGRHLYVFQPIEQDETSTLHVIDLGAGRIVASHPGIPGYVQNYPTERPDGRLLLPLMKRPGVPGITIVTIDPVRGNPTVEVLGDGPPSDRVIPSPDGRYLLRRDLTQLPRKTVRGAPRSVLGFGRRGADGGQVYYGLVWQMWEASPLRFVRRFVTQWMKPEELMDSFRFQDRLPANDAIAARREIWDAISAAMAAADVTPEGGLPSREHFRTPLVEDDHGWRQMKDTLDTFAAPDRGSVFKSWQPDGRAFWLEANKYFTCVGLDGSTSPRLYLERVGLSPNTIPLCARAPSSFVPLDGRQAEVSYAEGIAIIDGAPSTEIVHAIPESADRWRTAPPPPPPDPRGNVLVIPFVEWSQEGIDEAIDALVAEITPALAARASDGEIRLTFQRQDEIVAEDAFFDRVAEEFPAAAPVLRRLVERFVAATLESDFVFSDSVNGHGLLSHAVLALGLIDVDALPVVQSYGRIVDREHEHDFAGMIVPRLIEAHGWNDSTIDFVFWVLIRNYFNTLQDYDVVWRQWGLRDALISRDPVVMAQRITKLHRRDLKSGKFAAGRRKGGLIQLASDITKPHEAWLAEFLREAKRRIAE